jgi:protocatechuate 3,4-dioxygenase beta subunit
MKRNTFIKKTGSVLMAPLVAWSCIKNQDETAITPASANSSGTCKITDSEEVGPFPLYNKRGVEITHTDITEGKSGIPLNVAISIRNANNNCAVVPNASVVIWHCDKDGYYSGYVNQGYLGNQDNTAKTFCRGMATADANGIVRFSTIYPGWYQGRATHIHAQVYVGGQLKLSTQMAFPEEINMLVHATDLYKGHGQNTTKNTTDNVFRDSIASDLATVSANAALGGYDFAHTINIAI